MEQSYIGYLRSMVGDSMVMLNSTAVVITNEQNQILLQKRSDNGLWGLPGGLLELDETIEQGAIREVKEETNLDIVITRFIGVFVNPLMTWRQTDKAKVFAFGFVGKVVGGSLDILDDESLELRYFDIEQMPILHSLDNQNIVETYRNGRYNSVEGKNYHGNE